MSNLNIVIGVRGVPEHHQRPLLNAVYGRLFSTFPDTPLKVDMDVLRKGVTVQVSGIDMAVIRTIIKEELSKVGSNG